ncbi:MAG: carboxypeptidase-like regulatory domain-containing protein [Terracidiphilus sp.]|jgi:hypothetical protein
MKLTVALFRTAALSIMFSGALAQGVTLTGTVTDKTTGKPAVGDSVVLVDPQAGMSEVASTTTDAHGHYSLNKPAPGPALVRATHQGAPYFIAAPEGGASGDIPVFDVAAKVAGVFIEADVFEIESVNGQLRVVERYFVHNTSAPPTTQWSARSFEVNLPADAVVEGVEAQRPGGLPTSLKLDPAGPKGHFAFNFPIQPDDGEKSTLFEISYELPYSSGKYTFKPLVTLPAQSVGVLVPKSMTFTAGPGSVFQSVPEDPGIQTLVARNALPGKPLEFTVSGTGSIPREQQNAQGGQSAGMSGQDSGQSQDTGTPGTQPGGGIGTPIATPDPLSKYKWWILGGFGLLFVVAAAFLLRKPAPGPTPDTGGLPGIAAVQGIASPITARNALLNALKEELFAVESDRISGKISPTEYAELKGALETVLRRALKRDA